MLTRLMRGLPMWWRALMLAAILSLASAPASAQPGGEGAGLDARMEGIIEAAEFDAKRQGMRR